MNTQTLSEVRETFFPVAIERSNLLVKGYSFGKEYSQVIFRNEPIGEKEILYMGSDYELVPNEELFWPVYDLLSRIFSVDVHVKNVNNREFYYEFLLKDHNINLLAKDVITPKVILTNSYNGQTKMGIQMGYTRQICSNGLKAFRMQNEFTKRIKHTRANADRIKCYLQNPKHIEDWINSIINKNDRMRLLVDSPIAQSDLHRLITVIEANTDFPKKAIKHVFDKALEEVESTSSPLTKWLAYNAFNFQLNHHPSKIKEGQLTRIDKRILELVENF